VDRENRHTSVGRFEFCFLVLPDGKIEEVYIIFPYKPSPRIRKLDLLNRKKDL
jgi:hypothetical protein